MTKAAQKPELDACGLRKLDRLVLRTRLVLFWERLWPELFAHLILISLFISAALFKLFSYLPFELHLTVLLLCGVIFVGLSYRTYRKVAWPSVKEALFKLEKDSGFENQPLLALLDQPANLGKDKLTQALWIYHQDRMSTCLSKVVCKGPRSSLSKRDPYSLRAGLIILIILAFIEARFDWQERLHQAFLPSVSSFFAKDWTVQAWITPPEYTKLGALYIKRSAKDASPVDILKIPQNSKLLIRIEGYSEEEDLSVAFGPFEEKIEELGQGTYVLETVLDQGEELSLRHEDTVLEAWPLEILADMPPQIAFKGAPRSGFRGHFNLGYTGEDDYGLQEVGFEIKSFVADGRDEILLTKSLSGRETKGVLRHNLAEHPWSGQQVIITPKATDNAGQTAFGSALKFVLPERRFSHPVAQRLIGVRKTLYTAGPEDIVYSRLFLERLLMRSHEFNDETMVYLALRVAADRMRSSLQGHELAVVQNILWETAVHLDEGASGTARNKLEAMAAQMQDLLNGQQSRAAMEALFEQMRQSLERFLQQMRETMGDLDGLENMVPSEEMQMVGRDEMLEILERARELMRNGDRQGAQAMMDKFQQILSQLAMQQKMDPAQQKAVAEMMKNLKSIEKDQENLMDETFRRTRSDEKPSVASTRKAIEEAQRQNALRERLRDVMQKITKMGTKASPELREAEQAMRRAQQSLERGLDEDAVQAQTRALEKMRVGVQKTASQMARRMGMSPISRQLPGYDPLGRGTPRRIDTEQGDTLPSEAEMLRSREILQELYRRAGQKGRTDQELKYIERLLERF